ncbi:hypothetical protein GCM10009527_032580 [Actinomadura nitritigenes]|uniref:Integral membrane protein n=1 Tax=Actinomadura nitritigenes TaxID=134602 RepID=A0ABS3RDF0_9ACTN|nr:hypothetical protein [Actinomadura nitritigenes]MBO2444235.1 hypothetical protein [Actinomadura nitritigenes]
MFSFSARAPRSPRPPRSTVERVRLAVAVAYAAAVIAATGVVIGADLFADDPGFIGVPLIMITSPLSMAGFYLLDQLGEMPQALGAVMFYVVTTGAGALQTWLLWPGRPRRRTAGKAPSA